MDRRLTDKEFEKKLVMLTQMDKENEGKTNYVKLFLEKQDKQAKKDSIPKKDMKHESSVTREISTILEEIDKKNMPFFYADYEENKKKKIVNGFKNSLKDIIYFPFTLITSFFEWYVEGITWVKGLVLCVFAFTTIFCGWIAFNKIVESTCLFLSVHTPLMIISPFDSTEYFPWMLLAVVWLLPFIAHFLLKYVFVFLIPLVIFLALFEVIMGDSFLTDAFCDMCDALILMMDQM